MRSDRRLVSEVYGALFRVYGVEVANSSSSENEVNEFNYNIVDDLLRLKLKGNG